jgi:hypothetical protein
MSYIIPAGISAAAASNHRGNAIPWYYPVLCQTECISLIRAMKERPRLKRCIQGCSKFFLKNLFTCICRVLKKGLRFIVGLMIKHFLLLSVSAISL